MIFPQQNLYSLKKLLVGVSGKKRKVKRTVKAVWDAFNIKCKSTLTKERPILLRVKKAANKKLGKNKCWILKNIPGPNILKKRNIEK